VGYPGLVPVSTLASAMTSEVAELLRTAEKFAFWRTQRGEVSAFKVRRRWLCQSGLATWSTAWYAPVQFGK